jgi:hypothetical protein
MAAIEGTENSLATMPHTAFDRGLEMAAPEVACGGQVNSMAPSVHVHTSKSEDALRADKSPPLLMWLDLPSGNGRCRIACDRGPGDRA